MSNYAAPIEVVQAALHRLGEETITSLTDGSAAALIAMIRFGRGVLTTLASCALAGLVWRLAL